MTKMVALVVVACGAVASFGMVAKNTAPVTQISGVCEIVTNMSDGTAHFIPAANQVQVMVLCDGGPDCALALRWAGYESERVWRCTEHGSCSGLISIGAGSIPPFDRARAIGGTLVEVQVHDCRAD